MKLPEAIEILEKGLTWEPPYLVRLGMSQDQKNQMEEARIATRLVLDAVKRKPK